MSMENYKPSSEEMVKIEKERRYEIMKYLFVCKLSLMRSRAAAAYFAKLLKERDIDATIETVGISNHARIKLTKEMVEEADVIFAIDKPVYREIMQQYSPSPPEKLINLDIIDVYDYDGRISESFLHGLSLEDLCKENQENVLERPEIKKRLKFDDILEKKKPIFEKWLADIYKE